MESLTFHGVSGHDDSTDTPEVSVLVPCYNVAATVDEAVDSLLSQTLQKIEVVAVDDGSSDATGEHLARWAVRDRRVRLGCLPNVAHRPLGRR
jgi:glycosyltransferase involved in cell wall biosynthesis